MINEANLGIIRAPQGIFFNPFLSLIVLWSYKLSQNPISVNCLITRWQLPCSKWQLHKSNFMVFYHPQMDKCLSGPVYVLPVVNNFCEAALPHPPMRLICCPVPCLSPTSSSLAGFQILLSSLSSQHADLLFLTHQIIYVGSLNPSDHWVSSEQSFLVHCVAFFSP